MALLYTASGERVRKPIAADTERQQTIPADGSDFQRLTSALDSYTLAPMSTASDLARSLPWALRVERFDDTEWQPVPRAEWGPGPWQDEPDLVEWRSTAVPYPLLIIRADLGALCGYVGVPPSHPLHGRDRVYGTNWAGPCGGLRVPTGEPPDVWWLGFDCAHAGQYVPTRAIFFRHFGAAEPHPLFDPAGYVTLDECKTRVEALATVFLVAATTPQVLEAVLG